jgi:hypothetical protein
MKKLILALFTGLSAMHCIAQTTATNFNVKDCSGTNHDLYTELDAGKVVVISWVMPCASCIGPTLTAYNKVKTYATSHPGRVLFYLSDDVANTSCSSLTSWANTNKITNVPVFSDKAVKMSDYGASGMPKVVVLAGKAHSILFNQNNGVDATKLSDAIDKGLNLSTGFKDNTNGVNSFNVSLFPNPISNNSTTLNYVLAKSTDVTIGIYNTLGEKMKSFQFQNQAMGKQQLILNVELFNNGIYFIKVSAGEYSQTLKFIINK